jgi:hypothetical protein
VVVEDKVAKEAVDVPADPNNRGSPCFHRVPNFNKGTEFQRAHWTANRRAPRRFRPSRRLVRPVLRIIRWLFQCKENGTNRVAVYNAK